MEQTLQALVGLMVKAIPTALFLIFLVFYLRSMLFGPLAKVLKQREDLTGGAREAATASLAAADRKQQDYEAKFNQARAEVYKSQEETRRQWLDDQASAVATARTQAGEQVQAARQQIETEAATARQTLMLTGESMAEEIAGVMLDGRAGGAA